MMNDGFFSVLLCVTATKVSKLLVVGIVSFGGFRVGGHRRDFGSKDLNKSVRTFCVD